MPPENQLPCDDMIQRYRILLLTTFCGTLLVLTGPGCAHHDPLSPIFNYQRVGVEIGADFTSQEGSYMVGCGTFTEGAGTNLIAGAVYDKPVENIFRIELMGGFRTRHISGNYTTTEPSFIQTADGFVEADLTYDNIGDARFLYLFGQPSFKFYPVKALYVGAGVNLGFPLSVEMIYTKDILTKAVTLESGEIIEAFYPSGEASDPHSKVFPSLDPDNVSPLLIDPVIYLGAEIRLNRRMYLGPRLTYTLPVMGAISDPELKLTSLQGTIGIRYDLR
ncbi:MAG: hypothetical protein R3F28_01550 [Candidatus Kapaibacterium sp.]|nr:hypothetical protein [Ignavibacteria bacterium]